MTEGSITRELSLAYLWICLATVVVTRLPEAPPFEGWVHVLIAALFLLTAIKLAQREPEGLKRHGIALGGLLEPASDDAGWLGLRDLIRVIARGLPSAAREAGVALGLALAIFPPFTVGFYYWYQPLAAFEPALRPDFVSMALAQFVVVALPEEALFRGYFQTRLSDRWPGQLEWRGLRIPAVAIAVQAALFALVHFIVDLDPQRLAVFFPGLLFGLLRTTRGGIGAALTFHALSNLYADWLIGGWLIGR